nr:zinc ribbon domain-containing protein [Xylella fastidiosa]
MLSGLTYLSVRVCEIRNCNSKKLDSRLANDIWNLCNLRCWPAYTSQRCACCGHTVKENRRSQSEFECLGCGYTAHADMNAARNILAAGHAVLACGGRVQSGRPSKQEPTEAAPAPA